MTIEAANIAIKHEDAAAERHPPGGSVQDALIAQPSSLRISQAVTCHPILATWQDLRIPVADRCRHIQGFLSSWIVH
jgi:hypothetical protein